MAGVEHAGKIIAGSNKDILDDTALDPDDKVTEVPHLPHPPQLAAHPLSVLLLKIRFCRSCMFPEGAGTEMSDMLLLLSNSLRAAEAAAAVASVADE